MIPILYQASETAFTSNGVCRLIDCVACSVTEERNGQYECEFQYPVTGAHYSDILEGMYIACTHDDKSDRQPFQIYRRSAPLDGVVTFNARHISYQLANVIVGPYTAAGIQAALAGITTNALNTCPFTFWSDKTTVGEFGTLVPMAARNILGGVEGSILDVYGPGEYEFDVYTVKFHQRRGTDSGITIRYGKNMTKLDQLVEADGLFNAVAPYWYKESESGSVLVQSSPTIVAATGVTDPVPIPLDLSSEFQAQPTPADLAAYATAYLAAYMPWLASESITVDFVNLWQTEEYANVANLQRLSLCDTVSVIYPQLGVTAENIKIIKVVYDVLNDRYQSMTLGDARANYSDVIVARTDKEIKRSVTEMQTFMSEAIEVATELIQGGLGGHVVFGTDANGKPNEIYIIDSSADSIEDVTATTNMIRINMAGIGFSTNGGRTYDTAWTIDGQFVADYIRAGTLRAIMIQGPTAETFWDLATGIFQNYGETSVTAQTETSGGVYTPTTYSLKHITQISGGLLRLLATVDNAQTQTELFSLGLAGEGMTYDFYKDNNDSGSTFSYPYAGLDFNAPVVTGKSGIIWTQNRGTTATYTPYAHVSPDTLVLGGYKNLVTQIAGEVPNRNPLHLNGGWVSPENAIFLEQHYQIVEIPGGTSKEWYDFKRRVAWEICPGDNLEIGMWRGAGIYSNSKKDFRITIPLCRPISADVKTIEVFCTVNRAWQQGTAIVSANVDTSGSVVESWNLTGIVVSIRKDDGTAWSGSSTGTNNAPIAVQLLNLQLTFWGDEFEE